TRRTAYGATRPRIPRGTAGCSASGSRQRSNDAGRQGLVWGGPVRGHGAVPADDAVSLRVLQADLGWLRDGERPRDDRVDPRPGGTRAPDLLYARRRFREDLLLRLRVEPLRRRLAGVGELERPPQRV